MDRAARLRQMKGMPRPTFFRSLPLLAALWGAPGAMAAPATETDDWARCRQAITTAEAGSGIPSGLLGAIALVESGQRNPRTGAPTPWPWSYNVAGEGHSPPTKARAIAEVSALLAQGVKSVDVGCMQVNLMHHPQAFQGLEDAFDPQANLRYAARFLKELRARHGDWGQAIARYHSGEEARGAAYSRRVALARMGNAWSGGGGGVPLPPRSIQGICAAGLTPMLFFGGMAEARRFMTPEARRSGRAVPVAPAGNRPRLACIRNTARR
jgi:soluble lytic murein transglycosylase-like protein